MDPYHGYPSESLYHESHTLAAMAERETNRRERAEMKRRVKFIDAARFNTSHPLWTGEAA